MPSRDGDAAPRSVVLLAEDSLDTVGLVLDALTPRGLSVVVAETGPEALALAAQDPPDLVLMDIQLPGLDGIEVIRRLRASATARRVPIVALTALAMPGDRERILAAGADLYVRKPFSLAGLVSTVEGLLARRRPEPGASEAEGPIAAPRSNAPAAPAPREAPLPRAR